MKSYNNKEYRMDEMEHNTVKKAVTREVRNEKGKITDIYVDAIETYVDGVLIKTKKQ